VSFCRDYAAEASARQAANGEPSPRGLLPLLGGNGGGSSSNFLAHSSSSGSLIPRSASCTSALDSPSAGGGTVTNAQMHQVYYASVQSALYILCYHLR
jgi:hypothetical protein